MTLEPSCPGLPNCQREDEVIPEVEEDVNVDEVTDVLRSALSQYLFVDTGSIRSIRQIVGKRRTAPSNVEWQLHQAGRLCEFGLFNIIGNGHGPRRGTEGQTSSARHAWILRLGHCLAVSCSEIFDFRGSRCGVLAGQRRSRERAYVHRVVARVVGALNRRVAYHRAMGGAEILGKRFPPEPSNPRTDPVRAMPVVNPPWRSVSARRGACCQIPATSARCHARGVSVTIVLR
jgi:hypothetical protein